jgi:hypothetical protein
MPRVIIIPDRETHVPLSRGAAASFNSAATKATTIPFASNPTPARYDQSVLLRGSISWSFLILHPAFVRPPDLLPNPGPAVVFE